MSGSIKEILTRYITNTATAEDLKLLDDWVKSPSNQEELKAFIKDYYTIAHSINDPNTDHAVHKLLSSIKKRDGIPYRRMRGHFLKYAAAIFIMGILLSTYIFREDLFNQNLATPPAHEIKVGTDKAILTLADGSEIQLGEKEVYEADDFGSNGKSLEYFGNKKGKSKHAATVAYHFLTVPRGGKFMITLSDGTKVWLNSDSRLKYPTKFKEGESRMVELVYGEAYFDVSPAANNQGANFKVFNHNQEVKVLGTEFNIKAYVDDKDVLTTLVEGKINLKVEDEEQILLPGQQAKYDAFKNRIPDAYERLLMDVVRGNQTLFMRRDEVEAAWNWVDPIINKIKKLGIKPTIYEPGSWGPKSSAKLIDKYGFSWHEPDNLKGI